MLIKRGRLRGGHHAGTFTQKGLPPLGMAGWGCGAGQAGKQQQAVTHTHPQGSSWTPGGAAGCVGDQGTA